MKTAIYVRVSKLEQNLDNQLISLREYCQRNEHEIVGEYSDKISGTKSSRPQLDEMLKDMRAKKFDAIICWKFDRMGRSTTHLLQVLEEMNNKGIRLIATSQNIDTDTPMGKFFFTILSGFAEMEREMLIDRINLGLDRAKAEGKLLGRRKGSHDKRKRNNSGYLKRWENKVKAIA